MKMSQDLSANVCRSPQGRVCGYDALGGCPADDSCNWCDCSNPGGAFGCTLVACDIDGGVGLRGFVPSLDATLRVGAVELAFTSEDGRLTLGAPPSLAPVVLVPPPPPDVLRDTVVPVVARVVVSSVLTGALSALLGSGGSVRSLERLFADPGAVLSQPSGNAIQELLQAVAEALGLDSARGLPLPGGVLVSAEGEEAIELAVEATVGPDDLLTAGLSVDIATDRSVAVGGTVTLEIPLPSGWNHIKVSFGVSPAGVSLVVTPDGVDPITLLPQFSGFGPLVEATAASLLPEVLQKITDELSPPGPLGEAGLAVADELGIYDEAAGGFTGSAQVAQLRAMLQPGWLEAEISNPAALADLVASVFGAGKIELPNGHSDTSPGDLRSTFAGFYWGVVSPYIQDALRYLHQTQEGKEWINNLYSLVFAAEHDHHGS